MPNEYLVKIIDEHDNSLETVTRFVQTCDHIDEKYKGFTALMAIIHSSNNLTCIKVIQLLVDAGADTAIKYECGSSLLLYESRYGSTRLEIIQILIEAGADVNSQDQYEYTALLWLTAHAHPLKYIQTLINAGADVNIQNYRGYTALMNAVTYGSREIVQALIDAGADVNIQDEKGLPALMHALQNRKRIEIIQLLLDSGADINCQDKIGQTISHILIKENFDEFLVIFEKYQPRLLNDNNGISVIDIFKEKYLKYHTFAKLLGF